MRLDEIEIDTYIRKDNSMFSGILSDIKSAMKWTDGDGKLISVGKIGKFIIQQLDTEDGRYYTLYDSTKKTNAAAASTSYWGRSKKVLHVDLLGVATKYQGLNLPILLYSWIIKTQNMALMSGDVQSPGGRAVWEKLAHVPGIFMFGYDHDSRKAYQIDQNDLFNEEIYDAEVEDDIRILQQELDYLEGKHFYDEKYDRKTRERIRKLKNQINDLENIDFYDRVLVAVRSRQ